MEGDPVESINSYANLSNEVMTNDSYHSYFLALAKRGIGETEESNRILSLLANDNFENGKMQCKKLGESTN